MKMKIGLLLFALSLSPAAVFAAAPAPALPTLQEMLDGRQALLANMRSDYAAFVSETAAGTAAWGAKSAADKQNFSAAVQASAARFDQAILAMGEYQENAGAMLDLLTKQGKIVTQPADTLGSAWRLLEEARDKITIMKKALPADPGTLTGTTWAQIRLAARDARNALKESREDVHEAIVEIRNLAGGGDVVVRVKILPFK